MADEGDGGVGADQFSVEEVDTGRDGAGLGTLRRFHQAARTRGAEKVLAVATSAVREAENGGEFLERARRELNMQVKVVSAG